MKKLKKFDPYPERDVLQYSAPAGTEESPGFDNHELILRVKILIEFIFRIRQNSTNQIRHWICFQAKVFADYS